MSAGLPRHLSKVSRAHYRHKTLARKLAHHADDAVWGAIGDEEAAIRADPAAGGDPQLAGMLAQR